jgi:restriction endonuclease Mrr
MLKYKYYPSKMLLEPKIVFSYLRNSFHKVIEEIESYDFSNLTNKVIDQLKKDLCVYLEKETHKIEETSDEWIDGFIPSESFQNVVNEVVNRMIEEILKEIENYLMEKSQNKK